MHAKYMLCNAFCCKISPSKSVKKKNYVYHLRNKYNMKVKKAKVMRLFDARINNVCERERESESAAEEPREIRFVEV